MPTGQYDRAKSKRRVRTKPQKRTLTSKSTIAVEIPTQLLKEIVMKHIKESSNT